MSEGCAQVITIQVMLEAGADRRGGRKAARPDAELGLTLGGLDVAARPAATRQCAGKGRYPDPRGAAHAPGRVEWGGRIL